MVVGLGMSDVIREDQIEPLKNVSSFLHGCQLSALSPASKGGKCISPMLLSLSPLFLLLPVRVFI